MMFVDSLWNSVVSLLRVATPFNPLRKSAATILLQAYDLWPLATPSQTESVVHWSLQKAYQNMTLGMPHREHRCPWNTDTYQHGLSVKIQAQWGWGYNHSRIVIVPGDCIYRTQSDHRQDGLTQTSPLLSEVDSPRTQRHDYCTNYALCKCHLSLLIRNFIFKIWITLRTIRMVSG